MNTSLKSLIKKTFSTLFLLAIIGSTIYFYRTTWNNFLFPAIPCAKPITYSIGTFDPKFGISQESFLSTVSDAKEVWENAEGKSLFEYSATGTLKINLEYDYRQQATDKLNDIGSDINQGKGSYTQMKGEYDALVTDYKEKKTNFDNESAAYDNDRAAHDKKVAYWNSQGGAPEPEYQELKNEGVSLNARAAILNQEAKEVNSLSSEINQKASDLNDLAKKLNMKVDTFNTIGASTGEEFNEGEYVVDDKGVHINVYQFDNVAQLRRLLEHELGHALGLSHVDDPKAIMYRLNSSSNEKLTSDDLHELRAVCK